MTDESPLYLLIDQGGHSSRVVAVDGEGRPRASRSRPVRTAVAGDRVEQDPLELIASVQEELRAVAREVDASRLAGAGLAVQRASVVCWDLESGEPLSPVLSWMDRRGAGIVEASGLEPEAVRARTGLHLSPHYGASKLAWCLRELPAVRHALRGGRLGLGPVSAFLAWRLGGGERYRVDAATAQRTMLWDRDRRDWSPMLCEAFDIPAECLPSAVACDGGFGGIELDGHRVPLTVCAGDQGLVVSAYGPADPATVSVNAGTGAFVLMPLAGAREPADRGLLRTLAWSGHDGTVWVEEGTVNGAAAALDAADTLPVVPGPERFCMNGVGGLGAPWWIADYPSRFLGEVPDADSRESLVVESIVFLLMANIERLHRRPERVLLTGGLARRPDLRQWLADALALPVDVPADREATLRGLFARLVPGGAARDPGLERIIPAAGTRRQWRERQARWESLLLA